MLLLNYAMLDMFEFLLFLFSVYFDFCYKSYAKVQ